MWEVIRNVKYYFWNEMFYVKVEFVRFFREYYGRFKKRVNGNVSCIWIIRSEVVKYECCK